MHELSRRWVFEHRPCVELGVIIQSNLIFVVWCVRRARRGRVGRVEFVPGADVCVKRRVNIKYCNPVYTCDFLQVVCTVPRRRGSSRGGLPSRVRAARHTGTPGSDYDRTH
jgi:hypothetical protein